MNKDQIKADLTDKAYEVIAQAESIYGVKLAHTEVLFDLTGKTAGRALVRDFRLVIRLNLDAAMNYYDVMMNEVVPHEIAHLVNYVKPSTGRHHNKGWRDVCKVLGGNGQRCYTMDLKPARKTNGSRKTRKYLYQIENQVMVVGAIRHQRLQRGYEYTCSISGRKVAVNTNNFMKEIK